MSGLMKQPSLTLKRMARGLMALALALGATGGVGAASDSSAQSATRLLVSSDPAGATVYVDGTLRGTAPLILERLEPGDHRVKVSKEGYLENSRLVSVRGGEAEAVEVRLTRAAQAPATDAATAKEQGFWETHKKKILIGAGALAVGGIAIAASSGGEPVNTPPVGGVVTVSPTGIGVAALTSFTFNSTGATDADADPLTYTWNFGDGSSGTGQSVTHVYNTAGSFQASVTVSDGKAAATVTAASAVRVKDVTGTWINTRGKSGVPEGIIRKLVITQNGTSFTGAYTNSEVPRTTGTATGTLSAPRNVSFAAPLLDVPFNFTGTIDEEVVKWEGRGNAGGELGMVPMVFGREQQ